MKRPRWIGEIFYYYQLKKFLSEKWISRNSSILVVCGGPLDSMVLGALGFRNVLVTSLDRPNEKMSHPFKRMNAEKLPLKNQIFDIVLVHDGLHHCQKPHQAFLEMLRVAKKCVIVFEAQDSWLIRLLAWLKIVPTYEFGAGGVNETGVPNYIFRWSRREIEKILRSLDYRRQPWIYFQSQFIYHPCFIYNQPCLANNPFLLGKSLSLALGLSMLMTRIFPYWGNSFACVIRKDRAIKLPWTKS